MPGPISPVLAQPHDGIEHPITLVEDVTHLHAGMIGIATDPPQPPLRQLIKPGKTQIPAIKEQQCACLQPLQHETRLLLAIGHRLLAEFHPYPLLTAHIKQGTDAPGE